MSDIEELSFNEKVELLKALIDDLPIELDAYYGETGYISSSNVSVQNTDNKITVRIWTGICTG